MRASSSRPNVEVYCQRCAVSFPAGSRRCLHCGGRLAREKSVAPAEFSLASGDDDVVFEDELPERRGFSPLTLIWVALLLAGYLYRACVS